MGNNKDIGKAYKESLEGQSVSPHNRVWENIEKQLDSPRRRTLPLWLLFGGLALLIAIPSSIYIYSNYRASNNTSNPSTTAIENSTNSHLNNDVYKTTAITDSTSIDSINKENTLDITAIGNKEAEASKPLDNTNSNKNNTTETDADSKVNESLNNSVKSNKRDTRINTISATTRNSYKTNNSLKTSNRLNSTVSNNETNTTSNYVSEHNNALKTDQKGIKDNKSSSNLTAKSKDLNAITINALPVAELGSLTFTKHDLGFTTQKEKENRKNKRDTYLKVYGGPTAFGSLKQGYSIDESLQNNSIQSDINFNYGAALVFDLNKKSSVSVGIGKTDLGYTVKQADSINFQGNLVNAPSYFNIQLNTNDTSVLGNFSLIDLRQELSYLEFPILYYYSPIKNKLSLDIYGGPSFLALIENRIIAQSTNGNSLQIGQANNLGKFSVGLNIGVGMSYQLSNKFRIGLEPTFKYYINTFNNNSNYKPYSLGVNLGIRFKL